MPFRDLKGHRAQMTLLGRALTADDDRRGAAGVIVLGYGVWNRRFGGDAGVLGRRVSLGGTDYTVVGVMPKGFEYPRAAEVWIPLVPAIDSMVDNPQVAFLNLVGRLRPGVSRAGAREETERLLKEAATAAGFANVVPPAPQLVPLADELLANTRRGMLVLLGAAGASALVYGTSLRDHPQRPIVASAPWMALVAVVAAAAVWILQQPMDMRGMNVG